MRATQSFTEALPFTTSHLTNTHASAIQFVIPEPERLNHSPLATLDGAKFTPIVPATADTLLSGVANEKVEKLGIAFNASATGNAHFCISRSLIAPGNGTRWAASERRERLI